jgi:hypothetical protein
MTPVSGVVAIVLDDSSYELMGFKCPECGRQHYRVARWAGAFFSLYIPPPGFEAEDFPAYCQDLHENLRFDHGEVLTETKALISEHNSRDGIESDGSYLDQLMDFARLRLKALDRTGHLQLIEKGKASSPEELAVVMAFELGYAASELRLKDQYEDAIYEGLRLQEGRETGREAAADAKRRATRQTRDAIRKAALALYEQNPALLRNDAATAREIERQHLPALCRHGQTSIGADAIGKHLRALHQEGKLAGISKGAS